MAARGFGAKRKRKEGATASQQKPVFEGPVFSLGIDADATRKAVQTEFLEAQPYRHCVLSDVFNVDL